MHACASLTAVTERAASLTSDPGGGVADVTGAGEDHGQACPLPAPAPPAPFEFFSTHPPVGGAVCTKGVMTGRL